MPPTAIAAPEQEALESLNGLALSGGNHDTTGKGDTPAGLGAKAKRKRYKARQRAKKHRDSAADIVAPTTASGITEPAQADDVRTPSPPLSDTDTVATEPLPHPQLRRALPQLPAAPFVHVPVLPHYELRELPSAGHDKDDNDQGLFATQRIERGTRVISERPIITLTAPGDQLDGLVLAYENLSKADQERIWNLRPAAPDASEQLANLRFLTDRLAYDLQNIIFKPEATRTAAEQATLDEMLPKLQHAMNVWRIAARWHANRCSMTDLPMESRSSLPGGTPITGLFIARAHIRHSCVPNCFASFDANSGRMNVHVTRAIAAGEELTLSAFADNMYYSSAADRRDELAAWGLTCACEACDVQHPAFTTHESARQRAHARVILLNDVLTRLDKEELVEDDLNTAQSLLLSLIRDLKSTSCETVELARWRNVLVDRILPARALLVSDAETLVAWQVIVVHARECENVARICYGVDREEFRVLRRTREGAESAVGRLEEAVGVGVGG